MPSQATAFALCACGCLALGVPHASANELSVDFISPTTGESERVIKLPFKSDKVVSVENQGQSFIYGKYFWMNKRDNVVKGSVYVYIQGNLGLKDGKITNNGSFLTTMKSYKNRGTYSDPVVGRELDVDKLVATNYDQTYINSPFSYGETSSYKFIMMPLLFYVKDDNLRKQLDKNLVENGELVEKTELSAFDYEYLEEKKISGLDSFDKKSADFDIFSSFDSADSLMEFIGSIFYPVDKDPLKDFIQSASKKLNFDGVLPISYGSGGDAALIMNFPDDKNIYYYLVRRFQDNNQTFEFAHAFFGWMWNLVFFVYTFRKANTFISGKERRLQ